MWTTIAHTILRSRIAILIVVGLITLFMGYQATKVEMSYEYAPLLPSDDSVYIRNQEFNSYFSKEDNILVLGIQEQHFFDSTFFSHWLSFSDELANTEGVLSTVSAANAFNLYKDKESKQFQITPLFDSLALQSKQSLKDAKEAFYALPFYRNRLYNPDTKCWLMVVTLDQNILFSKARTDLIKKIDEHIATFAKQQDKKIYVSGLPYIRVTMAQMLESELKMFVALTLLITAGILFFFFRSFKVLIFTMFVVFIAVIWALGFMALFDFKITMITSMIPPLLIVIGVPNSVFLTNKYLQSYLKSKNKMKALSLAVSKVGNATFLTNLTTSLGFATFIITRSPLLVEFGQLAFISIMSLYFLGIMLTPIIFSFAAPPKQRHTKHLRSKWINNVLGFLVTIVLYKRKYIYLTTALILIVGIWGAQRIYISGYMVDDIPQDNRLIEDLKFFESNFSGTMPLEISIDTHKKMGAFNTQYLKKIDAFQQKIEEASQLSSPISILEGIKFARQAYYHGKEKYYDLPKSTQEKNFIFRLLPDLENGGMGGDERSFIDSSRQVIRLAYQIHDLGNAKMQPFIEKLEQEIKTLEKNSKFTVILTGTSVVHFHGTQYLIKNLFISVLLAIVLIAAFMAWMFASPKMVVVALIPNMIPLILTAAIMGFFAIPLKASTILVFSIAFGISVDDTIHFLAKYRQELKATNWSIKASVVLAIKESGISMIYTSIILFFGFGVFSASAFGGTVALGILVSVTLFFAMLSNLALLPALLMSFKKKETNKMLKSSTLEIYDDENDEELEELEN